MTESTTQEAVVLEQPGKIILMDVSIPTISDPNDVIIQIKATGICGSDIHYYTHGKIANYVVKSPMVLGHESSGIVVLIGENVKTLKVGDRVALEPGLPDRFSPEMKEGRYNLDPNLKFAATPPFDGTLIKYYKTAKDFVYKLPDHLSFEEGALMEPLSVAVHANKIAKMKFGTRCVVFGAGPIGLLVGKVASVFGATDVVFVDLSETKLERARQFGATHVVNSGGLPHGVTVDSVIKKEIGKKGADIIFECSGAQACIRTGIEACKVGGTFIQVGMGQEEIQFPISMIPTKELTFQGCLRYCQGDYSDSIELVSSGKLSLKPLITHRYKFKDAIDAFDENRDHPLNNIKTIIEGPE